MKQPVQQHSIGQRIFHDSIIATVINFIGQILGFVSTALTALYFGANWITDAYYLALVIPATLTAIFGGTLKVIFVPIFVEEKAKNPQDVGIFTQSLIGSSLLLSCVLCILTLLFATSGLWNKNLGIDGYQLTKNILILFIPLIPLTLLRTVLTGICVSYQYFGMAEFSALFRYVGLISAIVLLQASFGIYSLVLGEIVGSLCGVLLVINVVRRQLMLPVKPKFCRTNGLNRMLNSGYLPTISYMLLQMNPLTIRFVASFLPSGSLTAYSYAEKLTVIPNMLIGSAFLGVLVSHWSKLTVEGGEQQVQDTMGRTISMLMTIMIPATVGLFMLRDSVIYVLLYRGQFDKEVLLITTEIFGILVWYALPFSINSIVIRALFVRKDFKMFLLTCIINFLSIPCLGYLFAITLSLGVSGLALATTIGSLLTMLTSVFIVHFYHYLLPFKNIGYSFIKICVSCFIMAFFLLKVGDIFHNRSVTIYTLGLEIIFGIMVFYIPLRLLKHSELLTIQRTILRKII